MAHELVVNQEIFVEAPVAKVWEVLVAPKYIRQWDDLPQDFEDYYLEQGKVIDWSGMRRLTVTGCEPNQMLAFSLHISKWELPPSAYDIGYTYRISEQDEGTRVHLSIGDFGVLPDGQDYYQASDEFATGALEKIKKLAENRV